MSAPGISDYYGGRLRGGLLQGGLLAAIRPCDSHIQNISGNFLPRQLYNLHTNQVRVKFMECEIQIVAQVLAGQTHQFRKLVEHHHQSVYCFARNLLGNDHDAEDVSQEVFLAAFDHLASYNAKRASLRTWLITIARNKCVNYLKQKRPVIDTKTIADTHPTKRDDDSARTEFWRRLDAALDTLPVEQKTAFVLAEFAEMPYAEIAQIEQITPGAVKSRIHRAKQRLRAVMSPTLGE